MSRAYDNAADGRYQQGGRRNLVINGDFQVWQRGTSITPASAYGYTADRWLTYSYASSSTTVSRQAFTLGQTDVPGAPKYFLRCAATNNRPYLEQRIEDVSRFGGQTITVSFWAKSSDIASVQMSIFSVFGSGGSASITEISEVTLGSLSSSWQKYTKTITVGSHSGKTIGTNDYFGFTITTPSTVGTIDVALVQLEYGNVATPFEHRSYGEELALCQRYYEIIGGSGSGDIVVGGDATGANEFAYHSFPFTVQKRATPTVTIIGTWNSNRLLTHAVGEKSNWGFRSYAESSSAGGFYVQNSTAGNYYEAESEL